MVQNLLLLFARKILCAGSSKDSHKGRLKMKKWIGIFMMGLMFVGGAGAQDSNVSVDLALDGYSGYVWRGVIIGADDTVVLQPSITLGFGESGVSFNMWGSAFASNRGALDLTDELDFTIDYSKALSEKSGVGISLGFIEYTFPNAGAGSKHSEEAYIGLSLDNSFAPSVELYYDFGLINDYYVVLGIGPSLPLGQGDGALALDIGASVGFGGKAYGGNAGFNDVTVTASMGFSAGQLSITPIASIIRAHNDVNSKVTFWGGISIGFNLAQ